MPTQLISRVSRSPSSVEPSSSVGSNSEVSEAIREVPVASNDARLIQLMKSYQADQQVKYLHLQAEIEVLLQQLQTLKQQKQQSTVNSQQSTVNS